MDPTKLLKSLDSLHKKLATQRLMFHMYQTEYEVTHREIFLGAANSANNHIEHLKKQIEEIESLLKPKVDYEDGTWI